MQLCESNNVICRIALHYFTGDAAPSTLSEDVDKDIGGPGWRVGPRRRITHRRTSHLPLHRSSRTQVGHDLPHIDHQIHDRIATEMEAEHDVR